MKDIGLTLWGTKTWYSRISGEKSGSSSYICRPIKAPITHLRLRTSPEDCRLKGHTGGAAAVKRQMLVRQTDQVA
eukprot:540562-Prorocentrum_minimum.AAC.1